MLPGDRGDITPSMSEYNAGYQLSSYSGYCTVNDCSGIYRPDTTTSWWLASPGRTMGDNAYRDRYRYF